MLIEHQHPPRLWIMRYMDDEQDPYPITIAVPADAVPELERQNLAFPAPVLRGAILDAVVTVGMDSAALVTLLQTPDSVLAFAKWVRSRCRRSRSTIQLTAKCGHRQLRMTVDGDIDINVVADFLKAAFADQTAEH